jgi:putative tricarboxylic transport membrane protein
MRRYDLITALIMLALAAVAAFGTQGLDFWDDFGPSTRFMPIWVAVVTALLALLLVFEAVKRQHDPAPEWPDRAGTVRVSLVISAIIIFIASVPWLGFLIATVLFVLAMLLGIERRPVLPSLLTAAVTAGLIQGVFSWWLSIPLPKGAIGL